MIKRALSSTFLVSLLPIVALTTASRAADRATHNFGEVVISPDGKLVASIEYDEPAEGTEPLRSLVIRHVAGGNAVTVALPCASTPACKPSEIAFTPDSKRIGFVLQKPNDDHYDIEEVQVDGTGLTQRVAFTGTVGALRYDPRGDLAFLATPGAHKEAGAVKAGVPLSGEVGVSYDEQRIGMLDAGGNVRLVTPPDLYVYEFDWRPDGSGFVGTAAPGNGDNEWWVAKLWSFPVSGTPQVIYAPPATLQLASPEVSPDGRTVAFIGGIMSDFGSTGGDAYSVPIAPNATATDLTPGMKASVTGIDWHCGHGLTAAALRGSATQLLALGTPSAQPHVLWSKDGISVSSDGYTLSTSCGAGVAAGIVQSYTTAPEIEAGRIGHLEPITHVNDGLTVPATAKSIRWTSDGFDVQGWLLEPTASAAGRRRPLVTVVHGGPSAAYTPSFLTLPRDLWLLNAGYDVLLPNPRGSFGQGEAFTRANIRDFGHGDLRDINRGVDAVIKAADVDPAKLGIMGYSYGGYMTMWTVTQTDRFKAAVAGAGVSDWLSYYGENGIDQWMIPFFGASVYDDPQVYAQSSPINFIKNVRTPTFIFVGDRDLECPLPQSQEFWHALRTFHVPTEFVVYPGQGHELHDAKDRADARRRSLAWFDRWLKPAG